MSSVVPTAMKRPLDTANASARGAPRVHRVDLGVHHDRVGIAAACGERLRHGGRRLGVDRSRRRADRSGDPRHPGEPRAGDAHELSTVVAAMPHRGFPVDVGGDPTSRRGLKRVSHGAALRPVPCSSRPFGWRCRACWPRPPSVRSSPSWSTTRKSRRRASGTSKSATRSNVLRSDARPSELDVGVARQASPTQLVASRRYPTSTRSPGRRGPARTKASVALAAAASARSRESFACAGSRVPDESGALTPRAVMRPARKARGGRIPGVCNRRATLRPGMQRRPNVTGLRRRDTRPA